MYAYVEYVATRYQTNFSFSFPITESSELVVTVNGTPKTLGSNYDLQSGLVVFRQEMLGGERVVIRRNTNIALRKVDFSDTAILTEEHLDISNVQLFHALQEAFDSIKLLGG